MVSYLFSGEKLKVQLGFFLKGLFAVVSRKTQNKRTGRPNQTVVLIQEVQMILMVNQVHVCPRTEVHMEKGHQQRSLPLAAGQFRRKGGTRLCSAELYYRESDRVMSLTFIVPSTETTPPCGLRGPPSFLCPAHPS